MQSWQQTQGSVSLLLLHFPLYSTERQIQFCCCGTIPETRNRSKYSHCLLCHRASHLTSALCFIERNLPSSFKYHNLSTVFPQYICQVSYDVCISPTSQRSPPADPLTPSCWSILPHLTASIPGHHPCRVSPLPPFSSFPLASLGPAWHSGVYCQVWLI